MSSLEIQAQKSTGLDEARRQRVSGVLMLLEGMLKELATEVSNSLDLHQIGIDTKVSKEIEENLSNPLKSLGKLNESIKGTVVNGIQNFVVKFVLTKRSKITTAAYVFDSPATHFFVVLKDSSDDNKEEFYDFLRQYESNVLFADFPIIFHFVDLEVMEELENLNFIDLDGEQVSKSVSAK